MRTLYVFPAVMVLLSVTALSNGADQPEDKVPLPGLAVSLGMSVDEVAYQLQQFKFQHIPEKRWQKNGHSFCKPEEIICSAISLADLNEQLEDARFTFENHTLIEVSLTIQNVHNAINPLVDALGLVEKQPLVYHGLKGRIVVRAGRGNAENNTWTISRAK